MDVDSQIAWPTAITTVLFAIVPSLLVATSLSSAEEIRTSLIIEGGGLPPYCPALERLAEAAKVNGRIRIGFLGTAGNYPDADFARFVTRLSAYGVGPEQIQLIDLSLQNAAVQAENPKLLAQIRDCTAIFFGGGDQTRIARALLKPDGTPTAALREIYSMWRGGGVIAGTSAGAAVQSETMISASGFTDHLLDDGMDTLDFGLIKSIEQPARRGLLVTRGLGFLRSGIVDQHFTQYRGRLGRLARVTVEEKVRFGFGIDEDSALAVATDGTMEVLGPGYVTIVDTAGATCQDSSLGCSIQGVHLTCLGPGDRFDPNTGNAIVHPDKTPIEAGQEFNNGNFLIPDIAGHGAVLLALFDGLANNTSRQQIGIALKHHRHYGHGYRFTFSKTDKSRAYEGTINGFEEMAVTHIRLDIEPVAQTLRPPESGLPLDLSQGTARKILEAVSFRGIMLADEQGRFRPQAPLTRGELASAIAQVVRLESARENPPTIQDVPAAWPEPHDIHLVVTADLMKAEAGHFRPADPISRQEAAAVLVRLAQRYRSEVLSTAPAEFKDAESIAPQHRDAVFAAHRHVLLKADAEGIRPHANLTREEAAEALYRIIGFPFRDDF